jgi:hypothetical protein
MPQPRYNAALQSFIKAWRPNDPELDKRFVDDVRQLLASVLKPPAAVFEVETILSPKGGKVVLRLADYEAQIDPLDAQHLALSLMEAATAARTESFLFRFLLEKMESPDEHAALMIGEFRHYRMEEMQKELDGDFEKRSVPLGGEAKA